MNLIAISGADLTSELKYFVLTNETLLKGIVQKLTFTQPQTIQDVDEFVSSLEQIWRNLAFHHLLTNGSSTVNGCRQNESPNS